MISDAKPQNLIIVAMMVLGIFSGIGLANSALYYGGSYTMVRYLDVELANVSVGGFDPENFENSTLSLGLEFDVSVPSGTPGDAEITYFTAVVYLNGDKINYATFRRSVPLDNRALFPEYNRTFTIGSSILSEIDKALFMDAYNSDEWVFSIQLTIFYNVFDAVGESVRIIAYSWTEPPSGLPV
jgi:hypothetical protein